MVSVTIILLIAALILFICSAVGLQLGSVNLVAAGLACWVAVQLIGAWK